MSRCFERRRGGGRAARRHRRDVRRRRGDGRVRRPGRARGRRAARGPRGGRDPRRRCRSSACRPDRRQHAARSSPARRRRGVVTGDPVAVGKRLEQAAAPGEVLIGEATLALVGDAAEVEPVEPLRADGQSRPGCRLPASSASRRGAGAAPRHAVRRTRARARAAARGLGARASRAALRAGDGRRRGRRRQVPPRRRAARRRSTRRSCAAAACPTARGSPTGRSSRCWSSSTLPPATTPPRRRSARCSARRDDGQLGRRDRLGVPQDARAGRGRAAARRRLRRHPLGRGDLPRPRRAGRAPVVGRPDPARSAWRVRSCSSAARSWPIDAAAGAAQRRATSTS